MEFLGLDLLISANVYLNDLFLYIPLLGCLPYLYFSVTPRFCGLVLYLRVVVIQISLPKMTMLNVGLLGFYIAWLENSRQEHSFTICERMNNTRTHRSHRHSQRCIVSAQPLIRVCLFYLFYTGSWGSRKGQVSCLRNAIIQDSRSE